MQSSPWRTIQAFSVILKRTGTNPSVPNFGFASVQAKGWSPSSFNWNNKFPKSRLGNCNFQVLIGILIALMEIRRDWTIDLSMDKFATSWTPKFRVKLLNSVRRYSSCSKSDLSLAMVKERSHKHFSSHKYGLDVSSSSYKGRPWQWSA